MLVVGLTGGLASGKSHVGRELAELGCLLVKADELGHLVLLPGGEAYGRRLPNSGPAFSMRTAPSTAANSRPRCSTVQTASRS